MGEHQGGTMSIRPISNKISKNRTFKTASCLATYLFVQVRGKRIRCEPFSLALYLITYTLGHYSDSRVSCGWSTIEWVEAARIMRTYPPLYVLDMFATRLATKSIAQCLVPRHLILLLPTSLASFGPLRPLSVLIFAPSSGDF